MNPQCKSPPYSTPRSCDKEGLGSTVGPLGQEFVDTLNLSGHRASWPHQLGCALGRPSRPLLDPPSQARCQQDQRRWQPPRPEDSWETHPETACPSHPAHAQASGPAFSSQEPAVSTEQRARGWFPLLACRGWGVHHRTPPGVEPQAPSPTPLPVPSSHLPEPSFPSLAAR